MRAVGCLIGGAAGDALGYAVEFLSDERIFQKYGERGITDYQRNNGVAEFSDDTQMTLFTAEGLLKATNMDSAQKSIHASYLNWYKTQSVNGPVAREGLLSISNLYSNRAPGMTCLHALESRMCGSIECPINTSKGCGGVMRVAPVAIYCHSRGISIDCADTMGAEAAAITHGHELGYIPAAMLVHILYRILEGWGVPDAVSDALSKVPPMYPKSEHIGEAVELVEHAIALAADDMDDLDAIRMLGEGWVAEQTLAIAVYCCLKYSDNFDSAIIASVNHSGDSDSTGAVTGNIIGAYLGASRIPVKYIDRLELIDTIVDMGMRLCEVK